MEETNKKKQMEEQKERLRRFAELITEIRRKAGRKNG